MSQNDQKLFQSKFGTRHQEHETTEAMGQENSSEYMQTMASFWENEFGEESQTFKVEGDLRDNEASQRGLAASLNELDYGRVEAMTTPTAIRREVQSTVAHYWENEFRRESIHQCNGRIDMPIPTVFEASISDNASLKSDKATGPDLASQGTSDMVPNQEDKKMPASEHSVRINAEQEKSRTDEDLYLRSERDVPLNDKSGDVIQGDRDSHTGFETRRRDSDNIAGSASSKTHNSHFAHKQQEDSREQNCSQQNRRDEEQHQPGAYSVPGLGESSSAQEDSENRNDSTAISETDMAAVVVTAQLVEEDYNEELARREQDLSEKEKLLSEQEERLRRMELELEEKKRALESVAIAHAETIPLHEEDSGAIGKSTRSSRKRISLSNVSEWTRNSRGSRSSDAGSVDNASIASSIFDNEEDQAGINWDLAEAELGEGALRFAARNELSLSEQIDRLPTTDRRRFRSIKRRWAETAAKKDIKTSFSSEMILRFARCMARSKGFSEDKTISRMKKFKPRYLTLSAVRLETQLLSKTLFPVPGLKTKNGHDMFYMRPSRYLPKKTSTKMIIDNLAYVIGSLLEKEEACTDGIGFLAYMNDWQMKNFDVDYCYKFMMTLQGYIVPVKVQLFLIVNPPSWFGRIWRIMKPMLAPSFRKKVKVIKEHKLPKYLEDGFQTYLPDEMESGIADTEAMVNDFLALRKYVERHKPELCKDGAINDCDSGELIMNLKSPFKNPSGLRNHRDSDFSYELDLNDKSDKTLSSCTGSDNVTSWTSVSSDCDNLSSTGWSIYEEESISSDIEMDIDCEMVISDFDGPFGEEEVLESIEV